VDATCARLMGIDPTNISYLSGASRFLLGSIHEFFIRQRGEPLTHFVQHYRLPPGGLLAEHKDHSDRPRSEVVASQGRVSSPVLPGDSHSNSQQMNVSV
jgi:hypothetical protein